MMASPVSDGHRANQKWVFGIWSLGIFAFSFLANVNTTLQLAPFGLGAIALILGAIVLQDRHHRRGAPGRADAGRRRRGRMDGQRVRGDVGAWVAAALVQILGGPSRGLMIAAREGSHLLLVLRRENEPECPSA
jgi:hypothetical protein